MGSVIPVILSGGSGTRLWPVSTPAKPKQLQRLVGEQTLLQATACRLRSVPGVDFPVVVCGREQATTIERQLSEIDLAPRLLLVEPVGRNTAPAVAAAALTVPEEAVLAVFPSDHVIVDVEAFREAMGEAVAVARDGHLVTFGVVPDRPETGFGYIAPARPGVAAVERFVEKPDADAARRYVEAGYLWNSGMFVFTAAAIRAELARHCQGLLEAVAAAVDSARVDGAALFLGESFGGAPAISLDYAVMEKTDRAVVVPLDAGWSDLGSWAALWELTGHQQESVTVGDVFIHDSRRSYVRSETRPVAVIGVDDVVVVESEDGVLVVPRHRAQEVRAAAEWFRSRSEGR